MKSAHAEELKRAINESVRSQDEVDRLRKYLFPGILSAQDTAPTISGEPPSSLESPEEFGGTPWQRIQRREMLKMEEAERELERMRKAQEAAAVEQAKEQVKS